MRTVSTIGFIGAGVVGTALAKCLTDAGYRVVAVSSRSLASAQQCALQVADALVYREAQGVADTADLVFITTPDDAISQVAAQLHWRPGQQVVHCSGADSTDVLEPARRAGAHGGVLHPLQSFASPAQALENLPGSTFALEGDGPVLEVLEGMVKALGGRAIRLAPGQKVLYHAAAVIASNYLVTLMGMAARLWRELGADEQEAATALVPLMRGTLNNIERVGLPQCLTGPIARGDVDTVRKHLAALALRTPELFSVYRELAAQTLPIAEAKGKITPAQAEAIRKLLTDPESFAQSHGSVLNDGERASAYAERTMAAHL